jgi:proteasome lid subunit RPN8/RPN11
MLVKRSVIAAMAQHAEISMPGECCGLLLMRPSTGVYVERAGMMNRASSNLSFELDPHDVFMTTKKAQREGLEVGCVYHSHPSAGAELSHGDRERAKNSNLIWLVIGWAGEHTKDIRAWKVSPHGSISEDPVQIVLA